MTPPSLFAADTQQTPNTRVLNPAVQLQCERRDQGGSFMAFYDWETHEPRGITQHAGRGVVAC